LGRIIRDYQFANHQGQNLRSKSCAWFL